MCYHNFFALLHFLFPVCFCVVILYIYIYVMVRGGGEVCIVVLIRGLSPVQKLIRKVVIKARLVFLTARYSWS